MIPSKTTNQRKKDLFPALKFIKKKSVVITFLGIVCSLQKVFCGVKIKHIKSALVFIIVTCMEINRLTEIWTNWTWRHFDVVYLSKWMDALCVIPSSHKRPWQINFSVMYVHVLPFQYLFVKGATKSYFTHYTLVVIILFNTGLYESAISTYSFAKLLFLCFIWFSVYSVFWILNISVF